MGTKTKLLLASLAIATVSTVLSTVLLTDVRPLGRTDVPASELTLPAMFSDIDFLVVFALPTWSVLVIVSIVSTLAGAAIARTPRNAGKTRHP